MNIAVASMARDSHRNQLRYVSSAGRLLNGLITKLHRRICVYSYLLVSVADTQYGMFIGFSTRNGNG
jgi:hypothetical protein